MFGWNVCIDVLIECGGCCVYVVIGEVDVMLFMCW